MKLSQNAFVQHKFYKCGRICHVFVEYTVPKSDSKEISHIGGFFIPQLPNPEAQIIGQKPIWKLGVTGVGLVIKLPKSL